MNKEELPAELQAQIGQLLSSSYWFVMDQERINSIGKLPAAPDPMHVDPSRAEMHSPDRGVDIFVVHKFG